MNIFAVKYKIGKKKDLMEINFASHTSGGAKAKAEKYFLCFRPEEKIEIIGVKQI